MSTPSPPSQRSDAQRNRARILAAARDALAAPGADVSMVEIARRAGVGSATLYRNFSSRRELLEALYLDEIDGICAAAATVAGDTPHARLEAWLSRFYEYFTSKRPVAIELLKHASAGDPLFTGGYARVLAAGQPLMQRAQRDGTVRTDLTLEQVFDMIVAIAQIPGAPEYRAPIMRAALDALSSTERDRA